LQFFLAVAVKRRLIPFMPDAQPTPTPTEQDTHTMIGVRIPESLRTRIKAAAEKEHRTESSFARFYLERAADEILAESTTTTQPA
jgi:uncharacterized protein (DUF1778 family)